MSTETETAPPYATARQPERWLEVTPAGCRENKFALPDFLAELRVHLLQASYIIRWNLQEKTFARRLGSLWIVLDPILQACLYFFLLSFISGVHSYANQIFVLITSITFWRLHANLVISAPGMFVTRSTILQQTNFPMALVIYEFMGTELALFVVNLIVTAAILLIAGYEPHWTWLLVPAVLLVQITFTACLVMPLALIGTIVRDIGPVLVFLVSVWFYLSPVIYDVSQVPAQLRPIIALNPFSFIASAYRQAIFEGTVPDLLPLAILFFVSVFGVWAGLSALRRARYIFYKFL